MTDINSTPRDIATAGLATAPAQAEVTRRTFEHAIANAHENGDLDVQQTLLALLGAINALETTMMAALGADTRRKDGSQPPQHK